MRIYYRKDYNAAKTRNVETSREIEKLLVDNQSIVIKDKQGGEVKWSCIDDPRKKWDGSDRRAPARVVVDDEQIERDASLLSLIEQRYNMEDNERAALLRAIKRLEDGE